MRFLLDTNIVLHAVEGQPHVLRRLIHHDGALAISTLCLVELRRGLHGTAAAFRRQALSVLLARVVTLDFDTDAVDAYDGVIARCGFVRSRDFDRMIAAHAIAMSATLITGNTADFADISGLALEDWTLP